MWNRANNVALRKLGVGEGGTSSRYFQEDLFKARCRERQEQQEKALPVLGAAGAEVDVQNRGAAAQGSDSYTSAPFPCLIT